MFYPGKDELQDGANSFLNPDEQTVSANQLADERNPMRRYERDAGEVEWRVVVVEGLHTHTHTQIDWVKVSTAAQRGILRYLSFCCGVW